jgi:hypothetical protein
MDKDSDRIGYGIYIFEKIYVESVQVGGSLVFLINYDSHSQLAFIYYA